MISNLNTYVCVVKFVVIEMSPFTFKNESFRLHTYTESLLLDTKNRVETIRKGPREIVPGDT